MLRIIVPSGKNKYTENSFVISIYRYFGRMPGREVCWCVSRRVLAVTTLFLLISVTTLYELATDTNISSSTALKRHPWCFWPHARPPASLLCCPTEGPSSHHSFGALTTVTTLSELPTDNELCSSTDKNKVRGVFGCMSARQGPYQGPYCHHTSRALTRITTLSLSLRLITNTCTSTSTGIKGVRFVCKGTRPFS